VSEYPVEIGNLLTALLLRTWLHRLCFLTRCLSNAQKAQGDVGKSWHVSLIFTVGSFINWKSWHSGRFSHICLFETKCLCSFWLHFGCVSLQIRLELIWFC